MTSQRTKYELVLEFIRDRIISGEYSAGQRLPSDGQLVRMFSSSRPTVAKAMQDLEREGYLERRTGSGSFVRVRSETKASLVGMLIPEISSAELFEPICNEIASQCRKKNLSMLRTEWSSEKIDDSEREREALKICQGFISNGVEGVFFAPVEFSEHMKQVNRDIAHRLNEAGISIVLLDRDLERMPDRSPYDLVGVDNFQVGLVQTNYFIQMGEKRIVYVTRTSPAPTIDLRIAGYRHALYKASGTTEGPQVLEGAADSLEFVRKIIEAKPAAIVCSNDSTALMLMQSLEREGIKVPDDIKLIGVDDVEIAESASVPLTTINQPCREIGAVAAQVMVRRLEQRKKQVACTVALSVELVVRKSCGAEL